MPETPWPGEFAGKVIIEWPRDYGTNVPGWVLSVFDAGTGSQITTVMGMTIVHAHAEGLAWAEMTMFADVGGKPIFSGQPVMDPETREVITGTFPFRVQGMRVRDAEDTGPQFCTCHSGRDLIWCPAFGAYLCPECRWRKTELALSGTIPPEGWEAACLRPAEVTVR